MGERTRIDRGIELLLDGRVDEAVVYLGRATLLPREAFSQGFAACREKTTGEQLRKTSSMVPAPPLSLSGTR